MMDIESEIFSRIVSEFPETVLTKYSMTVDDNFSTEGQSNTDAVFPFVYVHLLSPIEEGRDLEDDVINGALATVQIDVVDTTDPSTVKEIMDEIIIIMKSMKFGITTMPEFYFGTTLYRQTSRCRRLICKDDTL